MAGAGRGRRGGQVSPFLSTQLNPEREPWRQFLLQKNARSNEAKSSFHLPAGGGRKEVPGLALASQGKKQLWQLRLPVAHPYPCPSSSSPIPVVHFAAS